MKTTKDKIYDPSEDDQKMIDAVEGKYDRWKRDRRPHEIQWFLNGAFVSGLQNVEYDRVAQNVVIPDAPTHRQRLVVNQIFPKYRARLAKFLKGRPVPIIVSASTDSEDKLNAKATEKVLAYVWRKANLETKYKQALEWSALCGKSYWWYRWDDEKIGRMRVDTPLGPKVQEAPLGDVEVEVGSAFEILVPDLAASRVADQPEIMRVKVRDVEEVKARYKDVADFLHADSTREEIFQYERQLASLSPKGSYYSTQHDSKEEDPTQVIVKELFIRPNATYPQGQRVVVANGILLKKSILPYGFEGSENPFPCTEFTDVQMAGRFFVTTVIEQMMGIQKEFNLIRSKVAENIRMNAHPKILVAQQHQLPDDAWNSEAGEMVPYVALPGIPPPMPWTPPNIASDAWRTLDRLERDFDTISQIYPSSEGQAGGAESGFQTNLLQEAADMAHLPDIRSHELSIEESAYKIRRLMALGYDTKRLISVVGRNQEPDVFEFSNAQIDEYAQVIVQIGSGLPTLKASRINSVMELWDRGMLGDPSNPDTQRKALTALDLGDLQGIQDVSRRDEDLARLENVRSEERELDIPMFYENHNIHYQIHTDQLKSIEVQNWAEERRAGLLVHVLQHMKHINHAGAYSLAVELGLADPQTGQGVIPPPPQPPPTQGPPPPAGPQGPQQQPLPLPPPPGVG